MREISGRSDHLIQRQYLDQMKSRVRKIFVLAGILICAVALVLGIFYVIQRIKISRFTAYTGNISSVSWRSGGGMDGGYLDYTAENTAKGYVLVTKEQKDGARSAVKKSRFKVDPEILRELDDLVDSYGAGKWGDLPGSETIALDAPTVHVRLRLSEGDDIKFSSSDEFPGNGHNIIHDIKELLDKYCDR